MKKSNILKTASMFLLLAGIVSLTSCGKYKKYDNNEVIENTYTGAVAVTSTGTDPAADFIGNGDSGEYSFAWENKSKTASLNFDITTPTGSAQMILHDKKGNEVLNQTLTAGSGTDTYAGISEEGKPGIWKVTLILTNFDGDGSYSVHPGN
ncbi:MAG: hypothetical protein JKY09_07385 [Crocinitomicaceae bacterium]|nr:hypothetical protein [Crocinitomicaceae bacterium]